LPNWNALFPPACICRMMKIQKAMISSQGRKPMNRPPVAVRLAARDRSRPPPPARVTSPSESRTGSSVRKRVTGPLAGDRRAQLALDHRPSMITTRSTLPRSSSC
jgi:hypothetical protein